MVAETESLWIRVVALIYDGELRSLCFGRESDGWSVWGDVKRGAEELEGLGVDINKLVRHQVGMGNKTSFWEDEWVGEGVLKDKHRLYVMDENKSCLVAEKARWDEGVWSWE